MRYDKFFQVEIHYIPSVMVSSIQNRALITLPLLAILYEERTLPPSPRCTRHTFRELASSMYSCCDCLPFPVGGFPWKLWSEALQQCSEELALIPVCPVHQVHQVSRCISCTHTHALYTPLLCSLCLVILTTTKKIKKCKR